MPADAAAVKRYIAAHCADDVAARPPMLSLDDALARLVARAAARAIAQTETVSTFDALGRVLAADVRSLLDVPPEDNSVDGRLRGARRRRAPAARCCRCRSASRPASSAQPLEPRHRGTHLHRRARCRPAPTRA